MPGPRAAARLRNLALLVAIGALAAGGCGGASAAPTPRESPVDALIASARAHEAQRRYDRAERDYRLAVQRAGDRTERRRARRALSGALLFWGKLAEAAAVLEEQVASDGGDVASWHDLGIVRTQLDDLDGAEVALARAVELAPRDPRPRIALAALLLRRQRFEDALAHYRILERLDLPDELRSKLEIGIRMVEGEIARRGGDPG